MSATLTSYNALFRTTGSSAITAIRIPRLQRDYAQGRMDEATASIRTAFLDVLHRALTDGPPVGLDFVFGDVSNGVLSPLDGQQRLTTLFLLHWYLAARANRLDDQQGWKNFTYETRASARLFCERLVQSPAPPTTEKPSAWIQDQSWFLSTWHHDPTVTSMLVVLDALHDRFRGDDAGLAWSRLVDSDNPGISFHLLPIREVGRPDELYIKMNSRGKPLTPFENFKACFEQSLTEMAPARARKFADRVDGAWSDMLWPMRGTDNVIDDEFMRYLDFIRRSARGARGTRRRRAARRGRTLPSVQATPTQAPTSTCSSPPSTRGAHRRRRSRRSSPSTSPSTTTSQARSRSTQPAPRTTSTSSPRAAGSTAPPMVRTARSPCSGHSCSTRRWSTGWRARPTSRGAFGCCAT
ncbi:MAG: DUF262 domain-containing protein [Deltaproteobacteria bacterium]|nr:DUF262 domain-containing protein [Deltaproteobacteria bacterium]